jgi:enterochelin esterase-like enzyme/sugar lactone lactonase YvrE
MNRWRLVAALAAVALLPMAGRAQNDYSLGPDSQRKDGVPQGTVTTRKWTGSTIFPGTERDLWVYVPKQYAPQKPACVMFFQDGGGFQDVNGGWRVPVVFDNLIASGEMPVTIAVFLNPGVAPPLRKGALPRYNRSVEYDDLSDRYTRFLIDEILPELKKTLNITDDPAGRAISGASSGGIAAFTAAWNRPDAFGKVLSFIGSFTDLRGGNVFNSLIRKHEPRPLRVFLQDGSNDQDIYSGHWFIGNNDVAAALNFAGYDTRYVTGTGGHDGRQGGAILPDALRWLWRGTLGTLETKASRQPLFNEVLVPGEDWKRVAVPAAVGALATDLSGNVAVADAGGKRIWKLGTDGALSPWVSDAGGATALAFAPDGALIAAQPGRKKVAIFEPSGLIGTSLSAPAASALTVSALGRIYVTERGTGSVWRIERLGKKTKIDDGQPGASTLSLTPDQSLLLVGPDPQTGRLVRSYRFNDDGAVSDGQAYHILAVPVDKPGAGATAMATDEKGWLYVASSEGIQLLDQAGRVNGILAAPRRGLATAIAFGGADFSTLYAIVDGTLYARKTKAHGVVSGKPPITPPGPRL